MKHLSLLLLVAAITARAAVEGEWNAVLHVGPIPLRLVLHLSRTPDGRLSGTLESIDQNTPAIPLSKVMLVGQVLTIDIKAMGAWYRGELAPDDSEVSGTLHQSGHDVPLTFRHGATPELARPQLPRKPYPYDEEEVIYNNPKADIRLAGTLTLPRSGGLHPAVLLITGSGPQDRDETIAGHKPFLVIADYLTRRGLAVLRVDDRGVGGSTGKFAGATTEDFAGDARAGIDFLKRRKEIEPTRIGLIGHSEGALIAPLLASRWDDIAFIVMLAGPGIPGEELLLEQQYLIHRAIGMPEDMAETSRRVERLILDVLIQEKDEAAAKRRIHEGIRKLSAGLAPDQKKAEDAVIIEVEQQMKLLTRSRFLAFLTYDPRPVLEKVRIPVLAMGGELDLQVPPKQSLLAIGAALEVGRNPDYEIRQLPHLNHLFQTATTGSPMEYSKIEETVAPAALQLIGEWIRRHTQ
jgi:pimeloyl-ACP methyl ester carboxylesterase